MKKSECKVCGGSCKPSKAFTNAIYDGNIVRHIGKAKLVNCMKCKKCGHSFILPFHN